MNASKARGALVGLLIFLLRFDKTCKKFSLERNKPKAPCHDTQRDGWNPNKQNTADILRIFHTVFNSSICRK